MLGGDIEVEAGELLKAVDVYVEEGVRVQGLEAWSVNLVARGPTCLLNDVGPSVDETLVAVVSVGSARADDCVIGGAVVPTEFFAGTVPVLAKTFTFRYAKARAKE